MVELRVLDKFRAERMLNNIPRFKVLLVDDREDNLIALESILKDENYELIKAHSGKEALSLLLKDVDFHLIILDVLMPIMNGFETAELIYDREKLVNIPIIFLTAIDIEGNIYRGYKAGAIDYISKPIIPELLKVKVRAFVELSEKNRELVRQEKRLRLANKKLELEISERKHSEEKIKRLNTELEAKLEQVQSLDSFNYSISHDLMSPLNSITALAGLLRRLPPGKLDEDVLEIVDHILKSSDQMAKLIKDLLVFSRQAHTEVAKTEFNMKALVDEVVQDISLTMPVNNTEIIVHNLPDTTGDNSMLKQVWTNLISNAIKYSQKKEKPRVEIGSTTNEGKYIYFVKDNGAGFDMKDYNRLFRIFQRLHTEKEFKGTGLGLAVVKRIVDKHQGRIWAESSVGSGTNFYFTLNT